MTITVKDTKNGLTTTIGSDAFVADANLSQGNPITATPTRFSGTGTSTASALANFETAIGGANNKTTPGFQGSGFRTSTWDGVKTDGTDAGGPPNTTVINGNTVAIPLNRFQPNGVYFGAVYAVGGSDAAGNTFASVNPGVTGLFPPFSPKNTFAMFNDNGIDFKFVAPSTSDTTPVAAASRGFGAVFVNVELPNTTTIQYFNGNTLLDTESAPVGGKGQPVFVGALFNSPIVTRVVLTLGTDVIFNFDGSTVTPGPAADDPAGGHNLVVTDDWAFPEPVPISNALPIVSGPQGSFTPLIKPDARIPFTGTVATFSDQDPNGAATDFTATINWGDGHTTNGTIKANGNGGFDVLGSHTYLKPGTFNVSVDVADFGGGPGFAGSVPTVSIANTAQVGGKQTTVGGFDSATGLWVLDPVNGPGFPLPPFAFGAPGFRPVVGDWNSDGVDTAGVFDPGIFPGDPNVGMWFLRNANSAGRVGLVPDTQFPFGFAGNIPVAGDWTGTGTEGIGVFDPGTGTWFLRNSATAGAPDITPFQFGLPGWIPVVGDWTGTGHTGIGAFDPATGTWYLRNEASAGDPDAGVFTFGAAGQRPVTGDWTGTGKTGIGVFVPGFATWALRSEANAGSPDAGQFAFGVPTFLPVAGAYSLPADEMLATGAAPAGLDASNLLTFPELQATVQAALARVAAAGASPSLVQHLAAATYTIGVLPAGTLGQSVPEINEAVFSPDAAAQGWFGDPTPGQDEEFANGVALPGTAAGHMDLLTAVLHEMGHLAGQADQPGSGGLMDALPLGTRRTDNLAAVFGGA